MEKPYKKTEKWWLGLTILFYALYNLPGIPVYGDAYAALWHGLLTIVPLWVVVYGGMAVLSKQRRLRQVPAQTEDPAAAKNDTGCKEAM